MAQYFTDFSEYTTGAQPSDWTPRWVTTNAVWEVRADGGATGGKYLFHQRTSGAARSAISWDAIDADADRANVEIVFRWRSSAQGTSRMQSLLRGSGSGSTETGYIHGWAFGSFSGVHAAYYNNGSFTRFGEDARTGIAGGTWMITRARINGSDHKVKHWVASDPEPVDWDIEETDSTITAAGWVGLHQFSNLSDYEVDWVGVGTNGDSAPMSAVVDPPQGTVTISDVTPGHDSALVTYSYDDTDETGYEARIDNGSPFSIGASPATISGLTPETTYDSPGVQVRAVNGAGAGDWSTAVDFTTTAAPAAELALVVDELIYTDAAKTALFADTGMEIIVLSKTSPPVVVYHDADYEIVDGVIEIVDEVFDTENDEYLVAVIKGNVSRVFPATVIDVA